MTPLQTFVADHQFLLETAAKAAGIADPIAIDLDDFQTSLLTNSIREAILPLAGIFVRDWYRYWPKTHSGVEFGARVYRANGIRFVWVQAQVHQELAPDGYGFFIVAKADYTKLFRFALRCKRARHPAAPPPVLAPELLATLRQNTLDFLDQDNLKRIRSLGGRPKRGLLFSGPPGNGKTSACRWILQHCNTLGYETKQVTPDDYRAARSNCNPAAAVRQLFQVGSRGVIFFDDMDLALRDRNDTERPEDQAVFLGAMDGIDANEGVVYVFTTNLPINRIDTAFRRPGRLDVTVNFPKPDATLRRQLVDRWHVEIRAAINLDDVVKSTDGQSFAEIEELKNLLVLRYVDAAIWDWDWARQQFDRNRNELLGSKAQPVGFAALIPQMKPASESLTLSSTTSATPAAFSCSSRR